MGIFADHIGPKKTETIGQLIVLLALFWGWRLGNDLPQLMALGLFLGVAGASFAVALPLAGRWYPPRHQGLAKGDPDHPEWCVIDGSLLRSYWPLPLE